MDYEVGISVILSNPFVNAKFDFSNPSIINKFFYKSAVSMVTGLSTPMYPGFVFKHSDGTFRLLLNKLNFTVVSMQSDTLSCWDWLSTTPIMSAQTGSSWCDAGLFIGAQGIYNSGDSKWYVPCLGKKTITGKYRVGMVSFDEDFASITYSANEIIDSTAKVGFSAPALVEIGGVYNLFVVDRDDFSIVQATSATINGTYAGAVAVSTIVRNPAMYFGNSMDMCCYIKEGSSEFLLVGGTSTSETSGSINTRVIGLMQWVATEWVHLEYGPIISMQGRDCYLYPIFNYQGHLGGNITPIKEDNKWHLFYSTTNSTDGYTPSHVVLNSLPILS
jgi:hypothetical protein